MTKKIEITINGEQAIGKTTLLNLIEEAVASNPKLKEQFEGFEIVFKESIPNNDAVAVRKWEIGDKILISYYKSNFIERKVIE